MGHPALAKQHATKPDLNKSKCSHSSINSAGREQVSIISLNSFHRSTPKFTQTIGSLPSSVMNLKESMSRTGTTIPAKMMSPHAQTQQLKQSQVTPAKSISIREKKAVPANDGVAGMFSSGVKKVSKVSKMNSKLRLKHAQSTV